MSAERRETLDSDEIVAKLRKVLRPTIEWYRFTLATGSPDSSEDPRDYLYDETWRYFADLQSRGDFQQVIEALL